MGKSDMGKDKYNPPYTVSEEAVNLIAEISSAIERYNITMSGADGLRLRKINRVKTIRGSTAIEGNTLSEEQITAVLEGKRVVARIAETYSISTRQAERLLTSLKKKGFIVREGSDKSGVWVVKKLDNKVGVSTI